MSKTTPLPRVDILEVLPELANQTTTTIRIHPRQGQVSDLAGSKMGGDFLWSEDEPWPTLPSKKPSFWLDREWQWTAPDNTPIELTPVLQLNKRDVPDFPFPEGKDLFQLLWQALDTDVEPYPCIPHVVWRSSQAVTLPRQTSPVSPHANPSYIPKPCTLTFERVTEYPPIDDLTEQQLDRLEDWLAQQGFIYEDNEPEVLEFKSTLYQYELSTCPDTKLGGYPDWIQDPQTPTCDCGEIMEPLLTIAHLGIDAGSWRRWLPIEEREQWLSGKNTAEILDAPDLNLGGGSVYYFVCRQCAEWPVKVIYQR